MSKTKIEQFEEEIIATELTDERLETFRKLLVRAGSDYNRNQHCYTTALRIPRKRLAESVKLIAFGIRTYTKDELGMGFAYESLARVYQRAGHFKEAHDAYIKAKTVQNHADDGDDWELLNTAMHVHHFRYSEEIRHYHDSCERADDFDKAFLNHQICLLLAKLILAKEAGDHGEMEKRYLELRGILQPAYKGKLFDILKKHGYREKLSLSEEALSFLKEIDAELHGQR